ncbi:uncharacterized protein LOC129286930 [Prosopis cineraria]|uniref:uncharacterized protein LOC129286930 n=1 Tax=Prosopis cineraria TaxID=364024 RepID=UPI0024105BE8|nr:uncharacterized protein LOC129286930 [Prosopis cineraria]
MAGESGGVGSGDDSGTSSPKNKIKFLCSHGGKILPRPGDGVLKYVGGETRVIAVPRDSTFSDFMKKVTALTDGEMVLKYQLVPEDLDALVTVRSDADLQHMFDEHDRHGIGAPMLRAFLFPSKPLVLENQSSFTEPHPSEQRYIDAINGIIHINPRGRPCSIRVVSSACSSPKKSDSPDGHSVDVTPESSFFISNPRSSMHRVRSSPSFSSLTNLQGNLHSTKYERSCYHQHHQHHPHGHPFVRLSSDPQAVFWFGRPSSILSLTRQDSGRGNGFNQYYAPNRSNSNKGNSGLPKSGGGHLDESYTPGHLRFERSNSAPRAPSPIWE